MPVISLFPKEETPTKILLENNFFSLSSVKMVTNVSDKRGQQTSKPSTFWNIPRPISSRSSNLPNNWVRDAFTNRSGKTAEQLTLTQPILPNLITLLTEKKKELITSTANRKISTQIENSTSQALDKLSSVLYLNFQIQQPSVRSSQIQIDSSNKEKS